LIAVDTNVLVYACDESSPLHERAFAAVNRLVSEPAWGLPWIVAGEFYSVLTDGRRWREPQVDAALAALDAWIGTPGARLLAEPPGHWRQLRSLIDAARPQGRKVHDARIAAVCLAAGVTELWSVDRDFSWYPQLRVRNPLVDPPG
jgi:toxin-antitoxin system PIN domain toxin